jgi:hypothetical protein
MFARSTADRTARMSRAHNLSWKRSRHRAPVISDKRPGALAACLAKKAVDRSLFATRIAVRDAVGAGKLVAMGIEAAVRSMSEGK